MRKIAGIKIQEKKKRNPFLWLLLACSFLGPAGMFFFAAKEELPYVIAGDKKCSDTGWVHKL